MHVRALVGLVHGLCAEGCVAQAAGLAGNKSKGGDAGNAHTCSRRPRQQHTAGLCRLGARLSAILHMRAPPRFPLAPAGGRPL